MVLGDAAQQDWEIHQVNVKSAYLICKLKKALYGLKQAGREYLPWSWQTI